MRRRRSKATRRIRRNAPVIDTPIAILLLVDGPDSEESVAGLFDGPGATAGLGALSFSDIVPSIMLVLMVLLVLLVLLILPVLVLVLLVDVVLVVLLVVLLRLSSSGARGTNLRFVADESLDETGSKTVYL